MSKNKLAKFADMARYPNVVECPYGQLKEEGFPLKGKWHSEFFKNDNPIVLELGCGRGEYTVGLARCDADRNFIGVDIKGARMWSGATKALEEHLDNVAFLRTNIELIDSMFAPDEVSEIWLTFSDPQMKNPRKRLTSTFFMERYRRFLTDGGTIHLKTDSNFLATYTKYMVEKNQLPVDVVTFDLYGEPNEEEAAKAIHTYYEDMWLERGLSIKYLRFHLPHHATLEEPDVEIPTDGYRSYHHEVRSTRKTSK